ncbi:unnamed protein product [Cunninghamella echinulata]
MTLVLQLMKNNNRTNLTTKEDIAVKLESIKATHPQLEYEARVYQLLAGGVGIPFVQWFGKEHEFNILVMDLLGPLWKIYLIIVKDALL